MARSICLGGLSMILGLAGCGDDTSAATGSGGSGSSSATAASATTNGASSAVSATASASTGQAELCPWFGDDPGGLVATGAAVGDVIENVSGLVDQCGVPRSLWDFAGGYRILSITTGW